MPTIPGRNGSFDYDVTQRARRRDTIEISYTPKPDANGCKDIRLSQVTRTIAYDDEGEKTSTRDEDIFDPNPFEHTKDDRTICGQMVDHVECEGDPYYNGDDEQDTASPGDATATPPTATEMDDTPGVDFGEVKDGIERVEYEFETCAICIETGRILDCFKWSMEATPADGGDITVPPQRRARRPSAGFILAFCKFVRKHSRRDPAETGGPLRWYCPETSRTVEGPDGNFSDPYGDPIPRHFARLWLFLKSLLGRIGGLKKTVNQGKPISVAGQTLGGGRSFNEIGEAIEAAMGNPRRSALKFTWSGTQRKTKKGVLFTPYQEVQPADVAPFVDDDPRFLNDLTALAAFVVPEQVMQRMIGLLHDFALPSERSPVTVSLIAGLGSENACGLSWPMPPELVTGFVHEAARIEGTTQELVEIFQYLALNYGVTGVGKFPSGPVAG